MAFGTSAYTYMGWENALGKFRHKDRHKKWKDEEEEKVELKFYSWKFWKKLSESLFKNSYVFWTINWITFAVLSLLCCVIYVISLLTSCRNGTRLDIVIILVASTIILFSAHRTGRAVVELVSGSKSYGKNEERWREILSKEIPSVEQITNKFSIDMVNSEK